MLIGPRASRWLDWLVTASVDHSRVVLIAWAGLLILSAVGLARLKVDTTIGSALNRSGSSWNDYLRTVDVHGGDEFIAIALSGDVPFDAEVLGSLISLTDSFEKLATVRRVDSLATVPLIRGTDDGLKISPALTPETLQSPVQLERFAELVRRDRIAPRSLVSDREDVFAINLIFDGNVDGDRELAVATVRELLEGHDARISGVPVVRAAAGERTRREVFVFVPLTIALVSLVLFALFRSLKAVMVAMAVGGAGTLLCLGSLGWAGGTLSFSTMMLPSVMLALGCAYTMHMVTAARGLGGCPRLKQSFCETARPVALSGLTTAIGFAAMATARIGLIQDLAIYGAVGVIWVTAAAVSMAPALLARGFPRAQGSKFESVFCDVLRGQVVSLVSKHSSLILILWISALAALGAGVARLKVESDVIRWFPRTSELRTSYAWIKKNLSGITPVNVLVEASGEYEVTVPAALKSVDELARDLAALPKVGRVLSVADPLRQMHREVAGPNRGLPQDPAVIDQYLLLLDGVEQMRDVLSEDRRSANIVLRLDDNASSEISSIAAWVDDWWTRKGLAGYSATTSGIMYEFGKAQDEIAFGGLRGLAIALFAIGTVLALVFRDMRVALMALVPNAIPVFMAFGFMGLAGIPVDAATVCLGSIALGVAVDDTMHVAAGFVSRLRSGMKPLEAIDGTLAQVIPALVATTLAIGVGFGVLALSGFTLVRNLGLLMASAVVVCLAADLLLFPALVTRNRLFQSGAAS